MQKTRKAILIFLFLLLLYALLRLLFYQLYYSNEHLSWATLATIIYWGGRLDISGIFYANLVFFLYYFLLQDVLPLRSQNLLALVLLSVINLPLLAVNIIDLAYYKFNLRRSTVDLFRVIPGSLSALGTLWIHWWWLFILFIVLSVVSVLVFKRILTKNNSNKSGYLQSNLLPCLCFLLATGILARGLSDRPIIPSSPLLHVPAQYQPLATNSTVTILYSILKRQTRLEEKNYFPASRLDTLFIARRQFHPGQPFRKMNVVVFVLESFAKEYMDKKDPLQAKTPFLDSIMAESIVCNNAYSNGTESNKGLEAIVAGLPSFFDEPFYYSNYCNNKIRGIGTLLKEEGYNTNFFMGAGYDHFGFARLSKIMGIDNYYSKIDYGNNAHYDGNWGIYDHYFLPYAARELSKKKTPFLGVIFTISTHFPYKLPDTLKKQFTIKGQHAEQNSMTYLDYSLRLFFEQIKNETWYRNTLFVFSADHNIFWYTNSKTSLYKRFRIPIFFYLPAQRIHKEINKPVQQLDIVPSVLDLLRYNRPFMSFGKSVFDSLSPSMAVNHVDDLYQAIDSCCLFGYNEKTEQPAYLYNLKSDTGLATNLITGGRLPDQHAVKMQEHLKAVMQYFNNSMIKNKLYIK